MSVVLGRTAQDPWWEEADDGALATGMVSTAESLRSNDETRRLAYRVFDDLFEGRSLFADSNGTALAAIGRMSSLSVRMLNFARVATEFVHSKCTAEVPTVRAAGHGATGGQRRRARQLSQFIAGVHDQMDLDTQIASSAMVSLRTGTGVTKVSTRDGHIDVEVRSPREFLVDPDDGRDGRPRVLYQVCPVDRRSLALEYPDHADACLNAAPSTDNTVGIYDPWSAGTGVTDAIDRYEAWVRPSDPDMAEEDTDGVHVVAVQGQWLLVEPWCGGFPVSFLRWTDARPSSTFWGLGLLERLDSAQCEIDDLVSHVGRSVRENNLKIFVDDGADISPDVIADPTVGTIIKYDGSKGHPPVFETPNAVSQAEVQWIEKLIDWLYAQAGMSQAAAAGDQASRLTSGRAILFQHDMTVGRYVDFTKRIGLHVREVIEIVLDQAHRLSETDPEWTVRYSKGSIVRQIRWADVRMERDRYVIELEEASPVPDSLPGRIQQVEEDAAAGRISPEYFAQFREDPDRWATRYSAQRADADYVDDVIDRLTDVGGPMPILLSESPLELLVDAIRTEVLCCVVQREDPRVIERLQRFGQQVADRLRDEQAQQQAQAPVPPQGQGGQGGPTGGTPPPQQ